MRITGNLCHLGEHIKHGGNDGSKIGYRTDWDDL